MPRTIWYFSKRLITLKALILQSPYYQGKRWDYGVAEAGAQNLRQNLRQNSVKNRPGCRNDENRKKLKMLGEVLPYES